MKKVINMKITCTLLTPLIVIQSLLAAERPTLVVAVVVDQMRADYLERFAPRYTGAFKKLTQEGVVYLNADLNYSGSETAPGHAGLSTGAYPRTHGVIANEWVDPSTRRSVYCVGDSSAKPVDGDGGGFSPRNLLTTTIGDWVKSVSPSSKIIAVGGKDRSAVLMGGQRPTYAFWYDRTTGRMVTSDYYLAHLPAWVSAFNRSNWIERNVPDVWSKLFPEEAYQELGPDHFDAETPWDGKTTFPHRLEPGNKHRRLMETPYGDLLMLAFAREAFYAERLGQRNVPDILSICLSSTDYIGHAFGPNSHELFDQLMRLDRALGDFLEELEHVLGREKILLVLTADHGVMPLPEHLVRFARQPARRLSVRQELIPQINQVDRGLQKELGRSTSIIHPTGFLNYTAARAAGMDSLALEQRIRQELLNVDGIADVYFRRELQNPTTPRRAYLDRFQRSFHPARSGDFVIRYAENSLITTSLTGTTHGSPYRYDTHVPLIFWGAHLQHAIVHTPVATVDIAPTLAKVLHVDYPNSVEGTPLPQIISQFGGND